MRVVYIDNPEQTGAHLKQCMPQLGDGLVLADNTPDSGIKLDIGHVLFSRLSKHMLKSHPLFCEFAMHRWSWHKSLVRPSCEALL